MIEMPSWWRLACALAAARCASGLRAPARRAAPRAPRRASASEGTILEAREVANKKAERRRIASSPTFFRTHGDFKEEQARLAAAATVRPRPRADSGAVILEPPPPPRRPVPIVVDGV